MARPGGFGARAIFNGREAGVLRQLLYVVLAAVSVAGLVFATGGMIGVSVPARAGAAIKLSEATAPEIRGITRWFNSGPLTLAQLRGKVVMIDFWTYGCINCVRTLPYVVNLYTKYKDRGFVVIGVHAPEFSRERSADNVAAAIKRHRIAYPVAQDNDFVTWNAYGNRYWPAQYIIDRQGHIVYRHAGEGAYDTIEQTVRRLLDVAS
jgi:thiol-disulfide isomerase/thioredoxin